MAQLMVCSDGSICYTPCWCYSAIPSWLEWFSLQNSPSGLHRLKDYAVMNIRVLERFDKICVQAPLNLLV